MENSETKNPEKMEQSNITKREAFIMWLKKNKKKLIAVGISISAIAAAIAFILRKGNLEEAETKALGTLAENGENSLLTDADPIIPKVVNDEDNSSLTLIDDVKERLTHSPHNVSEHIRNLPKGQKASPEKIETAIQNGFDLCEGQTWVETYSTGKGVA